MAGVYFSFFEVLNEKKLPVGIHTLRKIIEGNYLYIDKTDIALNMIENNQYVFLSRPRRFGKSLFLDTLKNIFEGNKELFKDLYIYDKWNFEKKHPVIKISFSGGVYNKEDLNRELISILEYNQKKLGINCKTTTNANICFKELIRETQDKYNEKVVILIDDLFINYLTDQAVQKSVIQNNLYISLQKADLKEFKKILFSLFASIPYNNYTESSTAQVTINNILSYEGYYASVIYAYLSSLGLNVIAEDVTNKGRIDLTVILDEKVYILEFKVLKYTPKTNTALSQIIKNNYHEKYMAKYSEIYLLGIVFNDKKRNIVKFNHKKVR